MASPMTCNRDCCDVCGCEFTEATYDASTRVLRCRACVHAIDAAKAKVPPAQLALALGQVAKPQTVPARGPLTDVELWGDHIQVDSPACDGGDDGS
jgi:hypothetical protein